MSLAVAVAAIVTMVTGCTAGGSSPASHAAAGARAPGGASASARPATTPASPNRAQFLMLGLLAALALGAAAAMGQELSDRSLRSEVEVGGALSLPVLAVIPQMYGTAGMQQLMPMQAQAEA